MARCFEYIELFYIYILLCSFFFLNLTVFSCSITLLKNKTNNFFQPKKKLIENFLLVQILKEIKSFRPKKLYLYHPFLGSYVKRFEFLYKKIHVKTISFLNLTRNLAKFLSEFLTLEIWVKILKDIQKMTIKKFIIYKNGFFDCWNITSYTYEILKQLYNCKL